MSEEENTNDFLVGSDGGFSEGWRDTLPEDIRESEAFTDVNNFSDLASGFVKMKTATPAVGLIDNDGNFTDAWGEVITSEFEDNQSLKNASNIKTLAKNYINQNKIVGKKNFDYDTADDEQKAELFAKMGVPEAAAEYGFEAPEDLPEGMTYNEEEAEAFANKAHELNLTTKQATELRNWYNGIQGDSYKSASSEFQANQIAQQDAVKEKYGAAYDAKIELAQRAVETFGAKELVDELGIGDNPQMVELFVNIGEAISEDRLVTGNSNNQSALTPAEAQREVNEIMANPAIHDPNHPQQKDLAARKSELYRMIHHNAK